MELFKKIEAEITAKRLNKSELAKKIGVTRSTVYNLNEKTAIGTIFKIIEALGKTPVEFLSEEKDHKQIASLSLVHEEGAVYGVIDYKEKYYEVLEENRLLNNELRNLTDLKKGSIKPKK